MMKHQVLFIHGGGEDGYHADLVLKEALSSKLGSDYKIIYPQMPSDEQAPDFGWLDKIGEEIDAISTQEYAPILIGHSLGASMLLKYLSERQLTGKIKSAFLLAAPFWTGEQDWVQGLKLAKEFGLKLPVEISFYFYHCMDDKEVDFGDLDKYRNSVQSAKFIELEKGGHQFKEQMGTVAKDIRDHI